MFLWFPYMHEFGAQCVNMYIMNQEPGNHPSQTLRIPVEDGERCSRVLLSPAQDPPAQFTAKRACPDYWSACSPHSKELSENE